MNLLGRELVDWMTELTLCLICGTVQRFEGNFIRTNMKRIMQFVGLAVTSIFVYLIIVYFIKNGWNDWDVRLALIGFLIAIPLLFYKLFKKGN